MKRDITKFSVVLGLAVLGVTLPCGAKSEPATQPVVQATTQEQADQYKKSADGRADSVVKDLQIDDTAKAARVHDLISNELVAIHEWHLTNDARLKDLGKDKDKNATAIDSIQAVRHGLHDAFETKVGAELSADQMETMKEKLTGGQMGATWKAYPQIVPNLTDEDKAMVLKTLQEGREEAMDANNKNDRIAIFKKYKGRINNYLNSHGHNVSQAYKDFGATQKAKQGGTTQPAQDQ